jgi:predicted GTPase
MALTSSYLITTKNLESFFNSLITAKAPDAFTQKFLESLEFKSSNDRLYIGLLKGLGFLDANAVPTERYFKFLDQSQSKQILAEAIQEAYGDLFAVNKKANELTQQEVKNKLRTLTQGKISDKVLHLMANTFKALVDYAEWDKTAKKSEDKKEQAVEKKVSKSEDIIPPQVEIDEEDLGAKLPKTQLHYNIQIHLPESRDPAVYDALFKSLKKHLF